MDEFDLVIIISLQLPEEQRYDFLRWYLAAHYREVANHPSFDWFVLRYAAEISVRYHKLGHL